MTKATATRRLQKAAKKALKKKKRTASKAKPGASQLESALAKMTVNFHKATERIGFLEDLMDKGQLIGRPAAVINTGAKVAHEVLRVYAASLGDGSYRHWHEALEWEKQAAINSAQQILTNPMIRPDEQHALWCRFMKGLGWTLGEEKDIEKKTHPSLVPFSNLSPELQAKPQLFIAAVLALANTQAPNKAKMEAVNNG